MEEITIKDIISWMLHNSDDKVALNKINKAAFILLKHDEFIKENKEEKESKGRNRKDEDNAFF